MADPRFFTNCGPFKLKDLANIAKAEMGLDSDPEKLIYDVSSLAESNSKSISFLDNFKYNDSFKESKAGACVVSPKMSNDAPSGMSLLLSSKPYRSYALIAKAFYPENISSVESIHDSAFVDVSVIIGLGCCIGANSVINRNVTLQDNVIIGDGTVIGNSVTIGKSSEIGSNVTLSHCDIGSNCLIHPGVRIGQRGFGFDMSAEGHLDVPQLGKVTIGNNVEIGANSCVDRGAGPDTIIGDDCKIDNLVQIAHNVQIGKGCVIVAQVGVAGSSHLGDFVVVAGQSGITGHINIAKGTQIAAQSGVMRDTRPGEKLAGSPAIPIREFFRQTATLSKLTRVKKNK
jgi:UDP-3-O-[3-hydroxymyristoyl] glucosamine N-acyltransferase